MSDDLRSRLEDCRVSIASRGQQQPDGTFLEPRLWERLRQRLQAIYRGATGETDATLSIEPTSPPAQNPMEVENTALRKIISDAAAALPNGAYIHPQASVGFMEGLPNEIALVCANLKSSVPTPPAPNVAGGNTYATAPIVLTEWERTRLAQHVSANALTYMEHHARGGLKPAEIEDMDRWKALSAKLQPALKSEGSDE